jgi:hypothetical protein
MAIAGALIDHEVERHDPGDEIRPAAPDLLGSVWKLLGQRELERAVYGSHPERSVFYGFDQHSPPLSPVGEPRLIEHVAGQAVDLAQVAMLVHRLGEKVIRSQMVAAVHDHPVKIPLFPCHPVQ